MPKVKNLGPEYQLLTSQADITHVLDMIGYLADPNADAYDYGSLFVKARDGEYVSVYGLENSVPRNNQEPDKLL